jgi:histidine transport system permease protein
VIEILQEYGKSLLWSDGYRFTGVAVTLWLLVASIGIGFCLSIPLAMARVSAKKRYRWPVWLFSYVFRGTPLYVQLLVFYTGVYTLEFVRATDFLNWFFKSGYNCTLLALVLNTCAYTTEIFAGAIRDTAYGEVEAARAYGFSGWKLYRTIILPSALRRALPAYSNEVILMLHATSLAFSATVPDILKIARDINAATYLSFHAFGIAAVLYLVISFLLVALFRHAERRWLKHLKPVAAHS